jgi:hypothetical protein
LKAGTYAKAAVDDDLGDLARDLRRDVGDDDSTTWHSQPSVSSANTNY